MKVMAVFDLLIIFILFIVMVVLFNKWDDEVNLLPNKAILVVYAVVSAALTYIVFATMDMKVNCRLYCVVVNVYFVFCGYTDLILKRVYTVLSVVVILAGYGFILSQMWTSSWLPLIIHICTVIGTIVMLAVTKCGFGDYGMAFVYAQYCMVLSIAKSKDYVVTFFGATTVMLTIYLIIALMWLAVVRIEKKKKGKVAVPLGPAFYIALMFLTLSI